LSSGVIHQLQQIFAIEGEKRRMHHFKNARQQSGSFKRAHALLLQQVGKGIHLPGQFAQRRPRPSSPRAEGVVALAQRRDHV
jgi:hypothetical protein